MDAMTDELDLLRRHAATLFELADDGVIVRVNERDGAPAPRAFVARGRSARLVLVRRDVPAALAADLRRAAAELPAWTGGRPDPGLADPLVRLLDGGGTVEAVTAGPAFRFVERVGLASGDLDVRLIDATSEALLARHFPYTRSVLHERRPVAGIVVERQVVSACYSARRGEQACEAGVDTIEEYRGRGYAPIVVAAWRDAVDRDGLEPLYSTTWENAASLSVARQLRLEAYADTLAIT